MVSNRELVLVLATVTAFILHGLFFIHHDLGMTEFVAIDYAKKTALFFICVLPPVLRRVARQAFSAPGVPWSGRSWFNIHILMVMAGFLLADQMLYWFGVFLDRRFGYLEFAFFPTYNDDIIKYVDLTFGLFWNSIAEELFYRAILIAALFRVVRHQGVRIFIAGILFGAVHWSQGWVWLAAITAMGWMLGYLYCLTRSIAPGIVIHTLHNVIAFTQ